MVLLSYLFSGSSGQSSSWSRCLHDLIARLKPAVILGIAIFYIHISVIEQRSDGWKYQRQFCYAEAGSCESPGKSYGVGANNNCYEVVTGGNHKSCTSDAFMLDCMASNSYSYTSSDLHAEYDSTPAAVYFLHVVAIIVVCSVILLLTLLFDDKINLFEFILDPDEEAFYRPDSLSMVRVANVLEAILVALMLWSAASFSLMKPATCDDSTAGVDINPFHSRHPPGGSGGGGSTTGGGTGGGGGSSGGSTTGGGGSSLPRDICTEFGSCGADVRSIIEPTDFAARYYNVWVYLLAGAFVWTVVARLLACRHDGRVYSQDALDAEADQLEQMELQLNELRHTSSTSSRSAGAWTRLAISPLATEGGPGRTGSFLTQSPATDTAASTPNGTPQSGNSRRATQDVDAEGGVESNPAPRNALSRGPSARYNGGRRGSSSSHNSSSSNSARTTMSEFADTLFARQTLVRKWEHFDVSRVRTDPELRAAIADQGECAICLSTLLAATEAEEWENPVVIRVPCGHWFHKDCLTGWIVSAKGKPTQIQNNTCPVCRANLAAGRR
jgi:hypothetical protein